MPRPILALDLGTTTGWAEEWRTCPTSSSYEVSSLGRVKRVVIGRGARPNRMLKPWLSLGYPYVGLWVDGIQRRVSVHRLVAEAFLPAPDETRTQVAHRNGDKTDFRACNLYWATPAGNAADRQEHGTDAVGEKNPMAKLESVHVKQIRAMRGAGMTQVSVAAKFGISRTTVSDIWRGKRWGHLA